MGSGLEIMPSMGLMLLGERGVIATGDVTGCLQMYSGLDTVSTETLKKRFKKPWVLVLKYRQQRGTPKTQRPCEERDNGSRNDPDGGDGCNGSLRPTVA